jgi:hypothetical protein
MVAKPSPATKKLNAVNASVNFLKVDIIFINSFTFLAAGLSAGAGVLGWSACWRSVWIRSSAGLQPGNAFCGTEVVSVPFGPIGFNLPGGRHGLDLYYDPVLCPLAMLSGKSK